MRVCLCLVVAGRAMVSRPGSRQPTGKAVRRVGGRDRQGRRDLLQLGITLTPQLSHCSSCTAHHSPRIAHRAPRTAHHRTPRTAHRSLLSSLTPQLSHRASRIAHRSKLTAHRSLLCSPRTHRPIAQSPITLTHTLALTHHPHPHPHPLQVDDVPLEAGSKSLALISGRTADNPRLLREVRVRVRVRVRVSRSHLWTDR